MTQEEINNKRIKILPFTYQNINYKLLNNKNNININKINEQGNKCKRDEK